MADAEGRPLIVTLGFDPATFARLDALRTAHFPAARNFIPAHLTLFHRLPASQRTPVEQALVEQAHAMRPFPLRFAGLRWLGSGVAINVESAALRQLHGVLAAAFAPWLVPQDRQPLRPHVTVMNKARHEAAAQLHAELMADWVPWEGTGEALLLWRYLGGPWQLLERFAFTGTTT